VHVSLQEIAGDISQMEGVGGSIDGWNQLFDDNPDLT